jgi:hypothetical protein
VKVRWPAWNGIFNIVVSLRGGLKEIMEEEEEEEEEVVDAPTDNSNALPSTHAWMAREFPFLVDKTKDNGKGNNRE